MELPLKGHDCVGRSYCFFLWGLTPSPHPYARSATLTKRDAKIFQIFTSQNFLSIFMDEDNNFFKVFAFRNLISKKTLTGQNYVDYCYEDKCSQLVWQVRERERCEASVWSRSLTLCGVWGCRTLKKKAVAAKKRQQACCRPPPVCDSRQLNSRLKKFYPISLIISVELMPKIGSIECRGKGYDCVGRSFVFLWGVDCTPHTPATSHQAGQL